jgi:hypothetical protein
MAREPHYPADAAIGDASSGSAGAQVSGETSGVAAIAPAAADEKAGGDPRKTKHLVAGAAIGIGSAAIVAALLYARTRKAGDKGRGDAQVPAEPHLSSRFRQGSNDSD